MVAHSGKSPELETKETVPFKYVDGLRLQADIYYPSHAIEPTEKLPVGE